MSHEHSALRAHDATHTHVTQDASVEENSTDAVVSSDAPTRVNVADLRVGMVARIRGHVVRVETQPAPMTSESCRGMYRLSVRSLDGTFGSALAEDASSSYELVPA